MEFRTRILPKMLNSEVEEYLQNNDIIIVPVGTVEMHGGFPLDSETVVSEALALKMAEACDGLVLTGLPYFYAGATASGRGTVQVSVRQGIDYLGAIARSQSIDRLRKAGWEQPLEYNDLAFSADTPEREILLRESKQLLRHFLETMKPTDREIFLRYYYLCENTPAIARRLGMTPDAVRQRLTRGREYLRQLFKEENV